MKRRSPILKRLNPDTKQWEEVHGLKNIVLPPEIESIPTTDKWYDDVKPESWWKRTFFWPLIKTRFTYQKGVLIHYKQWQNKIYILEINPV